MATNSDIQKKAMVEALEKSLGIITTACKAVGIARSTHYEWYASDEDYKRAVDDIADIALDFAESKLHNLINESDTTATIFYLKTKGKKRGYIEKSEYGLTDKEGNDVKLINFILDDRYKTDHGSNDSGIST